jgi:hypothetical protein
LLYYTAKTSNDPASALRSISQLAHDRIASAAPGESAEAHAAREVVATRVDYIIGAATAALQ